MGPWITILLQALPVLIDLIKKLLERRGLPTAGEQTKLAKLRERLQDLDALLGAAGIGKPRSAAAKKPY